MKLRPTKQMKTSLAVLIACCALAQGQQTNSYIPYLSGDTLEDAEWSLLYTLRNDRPVALVHSKNHQARSYPILYDDLTNHLASAEELLATLKRETNYTAAINLLCTSGEVCKVRGHAWFTPPHLTAEYRLQPFQERQCSVCGKFESRSMPPWPGQDNEWWKKLGWDTNYLIMTNMVLTNSLYGTNLVIDDKGTNLFLDLTK